MIRMKNPIAPRLPKEYQEVEYIESTGTQYIDTGVKSTNRTNIKLDIEFISGESSRYIPLLAHRRQVIDTEYENMFGIWVNQTSKKIAIIYGTTDTGEIAETNGNGRHIYYNESNKFYLDNTLIYTFDESSFESSINLYVFAINENKVSGSQYVNNVETRNNNLRLYEFIIYEQDTQIRNFVPCYRKSDNEVGLYDLVNDVFYENSGTGIFLMGAEVGNSDVNLVPMIGNKKVLRRYVGDKLVYGKEPAPYEQVINYTMLYDNGDECEDITGGWEKAYQYYTESMNGSSGKVIKNTTSISICGANKAYGSCGVATNNNIDSTEYEILTILWQSSSEVTTRSLSTSGNTYNQSDTTVIMIATNTTTPKLVTQNISGKTISRLLLECVGKYGSIAYGEGTFSMIGILKKDSWAELASIAGINANSIDDIITNSTILLSNKEATEYMIYNCTGSFMISAIASDIFLTALNSSPYKTMVYANEHWNKFLAMVA